MRRAALALAAAAAALVASCGNGRTEPPDQARPEPGAAAATVPVGGLCSTLGAIEPGVGDAVTIRAPKVRAIAPGSRGDAAELRFTYRGPSADVARLASGQLRRQVGLKLRAADGCNLVYVMWRIEPKPGLEVSVKRNPGARRHAECGVRGYRKVPPTVELMAAPSLAPGASHTLRAEIAGRELVAWIDGRIAWQGDLGAAVDDLEGPAGVRTDNVAVDLELRAATAAQAAPTRCPPDLETD